MMLPMSMDFLRRGRLWQAAREWRFLRRMRPRLDFYRQFVRKGDRVFDIGANVGHYALLFYHLGARVLAVEPQRILSADLQRRFARRPRVQVVRAALGACASTAVLKKAPGLSEIASLRHDVELRSRFAGSHAFSETEIVPVVTLDSLVLQFGVPGFCKIDVEGFEREVLAGLSQPLPVLSLEFSREFWPETIQCLDRLAELGNYRFNFALSESTKLARPEWLDAAELQSTLQSNSDPLLWGDIYARRH